jgi:hypothetical protein
MPRSSNFVIGCVAAGLVFGLLMGFRFGLARGIIAGAIMAVAFAALGPLFFAWDRLARRGLPNTSQKVHQTRELTFECSPDTALRRVEEAIKQSGLSARIKVATERGGPLTRSIFAGTTRPSVWSFGERLTIEIQQASATMIKVIISSRPVVPLTLVDFGRNWRNVERIAHAMRDRS